MRKNQIEHLGALDDPQTLQALKAAHPKLFETDAIIDACLVYDKTEGDKYGSRKVYYDPPISQISVFHDFLFDNRLVPQRFNNIEVMNIVRYPLPENFPEYDTHMSHRAAYHPKHYITYVKANIALIRKTLGNDSLTELEALDALVHTGDFIAYLDYWADLEAYPLTSAPSDPDHPNNR
jgi:hypothetical protein